jgi:hypothetical protein
MRRIDCTFVRRPGHGPEDGVRDVLGEWLHALVDRRGPLTIPWNRTGAELRLREPGLGVRHPDAGAEHVVATRPR